MTRFTGKVVIAPGAASCIGEGAARRFFAEGATLVPGDKDAKGLKRLAAELDTPVAAREADVFDMAACDAMVALAVGRFSQIDMLFATTGVDHLGKRDKGPLSDFTRVIETDLYGVVHMDRAAIAPLRESRGCIVNMSSVSGIGGDWNHSVYCATKGAVGNFSRELAMNEAANGVRVTPSLTCTALTADMKDQPESAISFEEHIPMGRSARPDDIAGVIAFLARDDARFVSGANLPGDGGLSASNGQPALG